MTRLALFLSLVLFQPFVYAEAPILFTDVTHPAGIEFKHHLGRSGKHYILETVASGCAFLDYDNDGDIDILISNTDEAPVLLQNNGGNRNHWISIRLVGTRSNRSGIGTRVKITAGGQSQVKEVSGGSSYASASDLRLLFGIEETHIVDEIEVTWPTGTPQVKRRVEADRYLTVIE